MNKIWIMANLTFYEVIKRRVVLVSFILGLIFLLIFGVGLNYAFQKLVDFNQLDYIGISISMDLFLNSGLFTITFLSAALGALLGSDTLSSEITSGTIQIIASKPIRRSQIVLGKWLSHTIVLALYSILMTGGVILIVWLQTWYIPDRIFFFTNSYLFRIYLNYDNCYDVF